MESLHVSEETWRLVSYLMGVAVGYWLGCRRRRL